ncbi:2-acylglycerophosphoethanolamine acyltransferase [Legionella rubrilucens]|uniref:2-acylglycerophosphoethanolamine acyltransferase n=1 Tax=Legionella rubrilucens TaxID=458 RepID=A0A0W0XX87_9GAMM|nr:acyl-[ACP]--phospholipid O-acyltransferase [Legionella rubrilucens]KTD49087.1 2-acylglycerophosphoethanolamine acyltransferase [Legionella rubrilucens]
MKLSQIKGFYPYLMLVFFNTFIDLGHKILLQDTLYQTADGSAYTVLSAIINALILLPYLMLFTPSGFIADKYSKARVLQVTAAAAIPLTLLATWCYFTGFFWGAFALTLLLAVQSALNSPAKYGYIKEVFGKEQLSQVNAIVQTLTIIAILGATFAFTSLFSYFVNAAGLQHSTDKSLLLKAFAPAGFLIILFSIFETLMSFRLIRKDAVDPQSTYHPANYFTGHYLKSYLNKTLHPPVILTCIIGLSVFWAVNQVLLASYGAFLKEHIGNVSVMFAQGSLALGGIGILLGALYAGKVSKGFVETGLIPVATLGIAGGLFILPHLTSQWGIVLLFLGYGFFGGMLIVPLNALIQFNAPRQENGKVLSANNFLQNAFMLFFLGLTVGVGLAGIDSQVLLYSLFIIASAGALYTLVTMPQSLVRYMLYFITSQFYRLSVYDLDNLPSSGGVLLLGNHVSFIDWAILQIACPRPIRFVMERSIYETWYLNWILRQFNVIPIARGASQDALVEINQALNAGEVVALFPEGRLTKNGQMGLFRSGFERSAMNANAVIIPFYIHGLWGSKVSYGHRYSKKIKSGHHRRITLVYGKALPASSNAKEVKQKVTELSIKAWKYHVEAIGCLQDEWLYQVKKNPSQTAIIEENGREISTHQLLGTVLWVNRQLKKRLKHQDHVGILLPTSTGAVVANLSLLTLGKALVNLNFTTGEPALQSAVRQASLTTIITSRLFLRKLNDRGIALEKALAPCELIYLEDLLSNRRAVLPGYILLAKALPAALLKFVFIQPGTSQSIAAILFSSGSEGEPKGVKLTQANLLSNINQVATVLGLQEDDVLINTLPLFHAFGLTVTTLMPLLKGIPMVCYPDPTKSLVIAKLICKYRVTLFCSTSSLLGLYARNASVHPQMLRSVRLVVAGAEKLSPLVYNTFKEKFNLEIYEGYGATEVAPVASCNLPDVISTQDWHIHQAHKPGTVGLPLPGCAFRVVDPVTLKDLPRGEDGLVLIGGTQVMDSYLNLPEKTEAVLIHEDNYTWYKTGDKGHLDQDGFLTIVDRYSRFAKIGGEMISLSQAEQAWQEAINGSEVELMALALPDDKKGEELAMLYCAPFSEHELRQRLLAADLPKIMLPGFIRQMTELPKLGNGKRDYVTAKQILQAQRTD